MFRSIHVLLILAVVGCGKDSEPASSPTPTEVAHGDSKAALGQDQSPPGEPAKLEPAAAAYAPLAEARFAEIKALMEQEDDWNPIRIPGIDKSEIVKFYVDTYQDDSIARWPSFAYEKMNNFAESKPTEAQDSLLRAIASKSGTRSSVYEMLMLMTPEQIETIGY